MDGLIISELARRSGVPTTTLRFYDQEGLLPARRSSAGYQLHDDSAVDRLASIQTAKSLGLQLPEIRQLRHTWQDGLRGQVQGELGPLLAQRIAQPRERIAELHAFADRLPQGQEQLSSIDRDGTCDRPAPS